jgi:hypothetical protein
MATQTPSLSQETKNRIVESVTGVTAGNQIIGSLGLYGGARITASADTVAYSTGDVSVALDSGGATCTYRVTFPGISSEIQSIDWIDVKGFTPRAPSGVETLDTLVCGYNYDPTLKQWYITIQIVTYGTGAAVSTVTSAGYVVGVRASVTLLPTANRL